MLLGGGCPSGAAEHSSTVQFGGESGVGVWWWFVRGGMRGREVHDRRLFDDVAPRRKKTPVLLSYPAMVRFFPPHALFSSRTLLPRAPFSPQSFKSSSPAARPAAHFDA